MSSTQKSLQPTYVGLSPQLQSFSEQLEQLGGHEDAFVGELCPIVAVSPIDQAPIPGTRNVACVWVENGKRILICDPKAYRTKSAAASTRSFTVPIAVPSDDMVSDLKHAVNDIILPAQMRGFDSSVVTVGSRGTGKTTAIFGRPGGEKGVLQFYLTELFLCHQEDAERQHMEVFMSIWEISGSTSKDLLFSAGWGDQGENQECHTQDPVNVRCRNLQQALHIISRAQACSSNWKCREDQMFPGPNKSHLFVRVRLVRHSTDESTLGEVHFVDLAGFLPLTSDPKDQWNNISALERKVLHHDLLNFSRTVTELSQLQNDQENRNHFTLETVSSAKQTLLMRTLLPIMTDNVRPILIGFLCNNPDHYLNNLNTMRVVNRAEHIRCACLRSVLEENELPFKPLDIDQVLTLHQLGREAQLPSPSPNSSEGTDGLEAPERVEGIPPQLLQPGFSPELDPPLLIPEQTRLPLLHAKQLAPIVAEAAPERGQQTGAAGLDGLSTTKVREWVSRSTERIRDGSTNLEQSVQSDSHGTGQLSATNETPGGSHPRISMEEQISSLRRQIDSLLGGKNITGVEGSNNTIVRLEQTENDWGESSAEGRHTLLRLASKKRVEYATKALGVQFKQENSRNTLQAMEEHIPKLSTGVPPETNKSQSAPVSQEPDSVTSALRTESSDSVAISHSDLTHEQPERVVSQSMDKPGEVFEPGPGPWSSKSDSYNALLHTFTQSQADNLVLEQKLEEVKLQLVEVCKQYQEQEEEDQRQLEVLGKSLRAALKNQTPEVRTLVESCVRETGSLTKLIEASHSRVRQIAAKAQLILGGSDKPLVQETVNLLSARIKQLRAFISDLTSKCKAMKRKVSQTSTLDRFAPQLQTRYKELLEEHQKLDSEIGACKALLESVLEDVEVNEEEVNELADCHGELQSSRDRISDDTMKMRQFLAARGAESARVDAVNVLRGAAGAPLEKENLNRNVDRSNTDYEDTHMLLDTLLVDAGASGRQVVEKIRSLYLQLEQNIVETFEREAEMVWAIQQLEVEEFEQG